MYLSDLRVYFKVDWTNTLPDRLRQEPDYNKFVRLAKKLMFSEAESV